MLRIIEYFAKSLKVIRNLYFVVKHVRISYFGDTQR